MTTALQIYLETDSEPLSAYGKGRRTYEALLQHDPSDNALSDSRDWLSEQLRQLKRAPCDLPPSPCGLVDWMTARHDEVGSQFLDYLERRKAGGTREYFSCKSHALYFLQGVAPTKMVDGSWLYGLVHRWRDDRFHGLIRTYLEELGDGLPQDNHVVMYRKLLRVNGCEHVFEQDDDHFLQGAVQLCLAHHCAEFLPEVIGFNLGYEQLPLHLLITTHELNELGIDPYYFQVHITVDNACTGHARKAIEAVSHATPQFADATGFYERVRDGYRLNDVGKGTIAVIRSFNLQNEVERIFQEKARHGRHMHSDYCRIAGRTINQWLAQGDEMGALLEALQRQGWIKRHRDPRESRFWKLLEGEGADMFGVFSAYERQVIHDWIAGDAVDAASSSALSKPAPFRFRDRAKAGTDASLQAVKADETQISDNDFDQELRLLEQNVMSASCTEDAMSLLAEMIGPATHHTPAGLMATKMFSRLLASG